MADLMTETLIPLCDVASRYPARGGRKKHVGVVRRWVRVGVAGVRLEAVQLAGHWHTSEEALGRFHRAVARARDRRGPVGVVRAIRERRELTPTQLDRAHRAAAERLEKAGWGK